MANPEIEVILPAGPIYGHVSEVSDGSLRLLVIRQALKNAGFAGFFEGYNPFTISDEQLVEKTRDLPVLRIQPLGIANGASDPGGWIWVWLFAVTFVIIFLISK
jgi:hypothetical protein